MTKEMISILPLSFSHIHVATSLYHLDMAYIYLSTDSICKGLLYIRSVFESGWTNDRKVDVSGISRVSFGFSVSQVLWPLQ
jgi:hypothetical protein